MVSFAVMQTWHYLLLFLAPTAGGMLHFMLGEANTRSALKLFLGFSGAFLLTITVMNLIPEVYRLGTPKLTGIFMLAGFFFQILIEQFSEGVEHGHVHAHEHAANGKIPLLLFISLSLHAFLEGIPLSHQFADAGMHSSLLWGIALHEIPAAFALVSVLSLAGLKKINVLSLLVLYALMSPIGAGVASVLGDIAFWADGAMNYLMALVIGTFLHISTTILFENSENHWYTKVRLAAICLGIALGLAGSLL